MADVYVARNETTRQTRRVSISLSHLESVLASDSHDTCSGPCECSPLEPDATCRNGWPVLSVVALSSAPIRNGRARSRSLPVIATATLRAQWFAKASAARFRKGTVDALIRGASEEFVSIPALISPSGRWAIHRNPAPEGRGWKVTHTGCGLAAFSPDSQRAARALAVAADEFPGRWDFGKSDRAAIKRATDASVDSWRLLRDAFRMDGA